jgi:hypothetical protein
LLYIGGGRRDKGGGERVRGNRINGKGERVRGNRIKE